MNCYNCSLTLNILLLIIYIILAVTLDTTDLGRILQMKPVPLLLQNLEMCPWQSLILTVLPFVSIIYSNSIFLCDCYWF
jgi:hypothetical protein